MKKRKPMENIKYDIRQDSLCITIDLKKALGFTDTKKNILIASTHGPIDIWDGKNMIHLTMSVFKPIEKEKKL